MWFKRKSLQVLLVFSFTSFWIFWNGIEPFCFCEFLFHCSTFDGGSIKTVGSMVGRPRLRGSPKYIRLRESVFLIPGEMGKKLLAVNSTDSVFTEFLRILFTVGNVD